MKQQAVDLFAACWDEGPYATVITTNGELDKLGYAVMGAGVAKKASEIWPEVRRQLGKLIDVGGNHCYVLPVTRQKGAFTVTFPTKYTWRHPARLELIRQSTVELDALARTYQWQRVYMPRVGCGNGRLDWSQVEPILDGYLDDRFVVCHLADDTPKVVRAATTKGAVSKAAQKRMTNNARSKQ